MADHVVDVAGWLRAHGYGTAPYDQCWLDCPVLGFLKTHRGREIVLCFEHARVLEAGKRGGSYAGAVLPASTRDFAQEWPWRTASAVVLV